MNESAFLAIFPFLFVGFWFLVTSLLGALSGWLALQERFPDTGEEAIRKLRFRSGMLGKGSLWNPWGNVNYGGCLRLDLCTSGLRVRVWRVYAPFCRPFLVPWDRISVEQRRIFFVSRYRLRFAPDLSLLTISGRTFGAIAESRLLRSPMVAA